MSLVDTSIKPYYDDYNEQKGFHKILFRPGKAVQVRELNQIQTLFEKQISRFGDNIFEEGSVVIPGELNYDLNYPYVKVTISNLENVEHLLLAGVKLEASNGITAILDRYVAAENGDPATLYFKYLKGSTDGLTSKFEIAQVLDIVDEDENTLSTCTVSEEGVGSKLTVNTGVYYIRGKFIYVEQQDIILEKYSSSPSRSAGFLYTETVVTENDDTSLVDNAQGEPNHTAPGAHRLAVGLELVSYSLDDLNSGNVSDDYYEIFRIFSGELQKKARGPEYNVLNEVLAQRTYEESGDYTVKSFKLGLKEHLKYGDNGGVYEAEDGGDETKYVAQIEAGLAYVRGFRVENLSTLNIAGNKARTTSTINNSSISAALGYYITISGINAIPDVKNFEQVTFYSGAVGSAGAQPAGTALGTARVRFIEKDGSDYRLYIFNVKNASGARTTSFLSDAVSVYASGAVPFTATLESTQINIANKNSLVFALNVEYVKTLKDELGNTDTSFSVVKQYSGTTDSNGDITFSALANESFVDQSEDLALGVFTDTGATVDVVNNYALGGAPVGSIITLSLGSGGANKPIRVNLLVSKEEVIQKTKTKTTTTKAGSLDAQDRLYLGKADAIRLISVIDDNANDVTDLFTLVPNKTSSFYDQSYVTTDSANFVEPITVEFEYYSHSSGDYFGVDSYVDTDYEDIPTEDGVRLSDVLDFRPRISDNGASFTGTGAVIGNIPVPYSTIRSDVEHYLARYDKVYVDFKGNFGIVEGTPSLTPKEPSDVNGSMTLYTLLVSPYTFNMSDISANKRNNRRYTMRDIGRLEDRLSRVEEFVKLNSLELEALSKQILDVETGLNRFKNGFKVDAFVDHNSSDVTWDYYGVSVSPFDGGSLRPEFSLNAVDFEYNETDSSNISVSKSLVTLPYTHQAFIKQSFVSNFINVNPYAVYRWVGDIKLEPSRDTWMDTIYTDPEVINDNVVQTRTLEWGSWNSDWAGHYSNVKGKVKNSNDSTFVEYSGDVYSYDSDVVDDRIINTSVVPYMRSREVKVVGVRNRPQTKMNFFFDGVNVNAHVKPEGGSYGQNVITNANGEFTAYFRIPNNSQMKFRTGEKVLRVIDDSDNDRANATSYGEALYVAEGIVNTRQETIVSTRTVTKYKTSNVFDGSFDPIRHSSISWVDPVAQSFLVESDGGAFVTKIDLYFQAKDNNFPITVDIREMENGMPTQRTVPGSVKTLNPASVNVSSDGSTATTFAFDYPVYLQDNAEYCFVVQTNSNLYQISIAKMGEIDMNSGKVIAKQPYAGVLFKSQNSSTWEQDQTSDIKFTLYRAQFDTNVQGVVYLDNKDFDYITLREDPIYTENGSSEITVYKQYHNYVVGSVVEIQGAESGNGIDAASINTTLTVTEIVSRNEFKVDTGDAASATGYIGGSDVSISNTVQASVLNPNFVDIKFPDTNIVYEVRNTTGKSVNGSEVPYTDTGAWIEVENKEINEMDAPCLCTSTVDESANFAGNKTMRCRATLSSTNPNVSPVFDMESVSVITPYYLVNKNESLAIDGSNNYANYRTLPITITQPANALRVYINLNKPQDADVKVLARFGNSQEELDEDTWREMTGVATFFTNSKDEFSENEYMLNDLSDYTMVQVMIQFKSSSSVRIPIGKKLKIVALGT